MIVRYFRRVDAFVAGRENSLRQVLSGFSIDFKRVIALSRAKRVFTHRSYLNKFFEIGVNRNN